MSTASPKRNLVVLGMHRSGTSMVACALGELGLRLGDSNEMLAAQADNPRGFGERLDVVALNEKILADHGSCWFGGLETPVDTDRYGAEQAEILSRLGSDGWLLKDPRFTLTWPAWERQFADALLVFVYRDAQAVASSLARRNGFPLDFGLALWEYNNRRILGLLRGREHVAVAYEKFARQPRRQLLDLQAALNVMGAGLPAGQELAEDFFDAALVHGSRGAGPVASFMTSSQQELAGLCVEIVQRGHCDTSVAPATELLLARIDDFSTAFVHSASAREVQVQMDARTAELQEVREDRLQLLEQHRALEAEYAQLDSQQQALAQAHERDGSELGFLREKHAEHEQLLLEKQEQIETLLQTRDELQLSVTELQQETADTTAKAEYLFFELDTVYNSLRGFSESGLGRLSAWFAAFYKLVSLRRGSNTAYDDVLDKAELHFADFGRSANQPARSRAGLLLEVIRYVLSNPAGSLRSFSLPRLQRALSVFIGADRQDLAVWVNQRFPSADAAAMMSVLPEFGSEWDSRQLSFPQCENPCVSIVLPAFNEYRMTVACLDSILEHSADVDYEVIVADDASTDMTATIAERISGIQVVRPEHNQGFVRNCNAGAAVARGQYLLFLNNDTAVTSGWLSALVSVLDSNDSVGVVGPRLLCSSGELQEAGGIIWDDASGWNFGRLDQADKPEYNYVKSVDYVSGACLLVRHSLWRSLGGFDELFVPAYYEDTDLCFAARQAGFDVVYQPASRVFHFEGVTNGTDLHSGIKQYQLENQLKFRDKWQAVLQHEHFPNGEQVFHARDRSRGKRTILVIDHYVPSYDKDAGSRATWQYLELFVQMGYNVKFIGANFFPHKPYTEMLQQLGVEVLVGEQMARNFDSWLHRHAADIDAIYLHRPHVAEQFLPALQRMQPRPKLIFFGHDLHYLRKQREFALTGEAAIQAEAEQWRKREYKLFDVMDQVYYPSQVEVDEIATQRPELNVRAIPLYAIDSVEPRAFLPAARRDMLFVGGFNHPPNADGMHWFAEQVMPLLLQEQPGAVLHVVGSSMPEDVIALASDNIVIHGYLSESALLELYAAIRMVIVPLRFGAGVKGKVIEGLQQGVPVVTTSVGAEGLPEPESVLHIADEAEEFARCILQIERFEAGVSQRLAAYPAYLQSHFSKTVAAEIIRQDFGAAEPPRQ